MFCVNCLKQPAAMIRFTHASVFEHDPRTLFAWHERPGALERLAPLWAPVHIENAEGIREGCRTVVRLGWGPLSTRCVALHTAYDEGKLFEDEQESGPFTSWRHRHRFEPHGKGRCRLVDDIELEPPLGDVGEMLGAGCLQSNLEELFSYRHRVLANDLSLHRKYRTRPLTVAITGSSGLLGSALSAFLTTGGHRVLRLVRRAPRLETDIAWSPKEGRVETEKLEGVDAVVHLAGENLFAPRWSEAKKRRIYDSRIESTKLISEVIARLKNPPSVLISSSAIGIYGDRGAEPLTEASEIDADSFLARLCADWEAAAQSAREAGVRTVHPRTGIVLSGAGGALAPMLPFFKVGLGGRFGIPEAYLSWISLDDVLGVFYHAMHTPEIDGALNLTTPEPVTWNEFAPAMGDVLHRPTFVTVPPWLIRLASGEVAEDVILPSARVIPAVLQRTGYDFLFPNLRQALRHQLGRSRTG